MRKGMVALVVWVLVLSQALGFSSAAGRRWRKSMSSSEMMSSTMVNRVGSSILFPFGPSILFPVDGNVYPIGYYNVTLYIGQPAKPYFLDVDTGSDLTWLRCDAQCIHCTEAPHQLYRPSNDPVVCKDPLCTSSHSPGDHKCESQEQCDYNIEYADGSSSFGVLVRDAFALKYTNGVRLSPRLVLGCGYDQDPGASYHPVDGVLGLGNGKFSILSQLNSQGLVQNVIGHCLSGRGGGFIFFGNNLYHSSSVVWTSMSREHTKYYSPGLAELFFGGKTTGSKNLVVVFDSGSSFTYLNSEAYQTLTLLVKRELSGKPLQEAPEDQTLSLCWKGQGKFKNMRDVKKYFKPLALSFTSEKAKTLFDIPPEAYLIISSKGNVCLGILNGTEVGLQDLNLIGDISMLDKMMIYDNENQAIGWIPANCNRLPKSETVLV